MIGFVMAMNSHGNSSTRISPDHDYLERRFDEQRLRPHLDISINPTDVLCGRGKSSFTHGKFSTSSSDIMYNCTGGAQSIFTLSFA